MKVLGAGAFVKCNGQKNYIFTIITNFKGLLQLAVRVFAANFLHRNDSNATVVRHSHFTEVKLLFAKEYLYVIYRITHS